MSLLDSPIPLSDIESVLAWVDTFKLSRPTKKINRDFSDAVLLAEMLSVHYPKLVEMHNYPPRNSHSLKLNNWMTLNRKVLKKLKLSLCLNTMEQLANCAPGVIERVLVMVRDKVRRDEEMNKCLKETEQNMSSGGSYYEACGDENVLIVPVKTRVNGVLETIQQKVVNYQSYISLKEELKDIKDTADLLKQKVEHLDNLIKLKDERIEELQRQLDRKQTRRKEVEAFQNSLSIPLEPEPPSPKITELVTVPSKPTNVTNQPNPMPQENLKPIEYNVKNGKEESKIPIPVIDMRKSLSKPSLTAVSREFSEHEIDNVDKVKSDVFKEVEIIDERYLDGFHDSHEFINEPHHPIVTIHDTIQRDTTDISKAEFIQEITYIN